MLKAQVQRFDEETRETAVENVLASLTQAQRNAKARLVSEEEVRYVLQRFINSPGEVRGYLFHGGNVPRAYRYPAETTLGEVAGWYPGFLVYAFHRGAARRTLYGRVTESETGWMHPLDAARLSGPHLVNQDLTAHRAKLTAVYGNLPEDAFTVVELEPPVAFRFTRTVPLAVSLTGEEYLLLGPGCAVRTPPLYHWQTWAAELKERGLWPLVRDWGRGRLTPEEAYVAFGLLDPTLLV